MGDLPFTAEIDWMLRSKNRPRKDHFNLDRLQRSPRAGRAVAEPFLQKRERGKKILFFATLHYWIEQAAQLLFPRAGGAWSQSYAADFALF